MVQLDNRIYNETGKHLTYVMGRIQIRGASGAVGYARGVITGDQIIVQADHLRVPMEQIADHEAYHAKADFTDGRLNAEIRKHIIETFSAEEFQKVLDQYIVSLRGVIDVNEARTADEFDAAVRQIEEEVFADAYAGINAFSAGADRFTDAVNQRMDQLYMGKNRDQDNGTAEPTGPPADTSAEAGGKSGQAAGERFSYAGENANNADMEALARAKEMQAAGVADETIRQQTGWHTGMDGKWRWEIDDSGMKYSSRGDLGFRERNKGYDRYRTLTEKAEAYMLGKSDTWLSEEEQQELTELQGTYGEAFREDGRTSADALPQTRLADYLKHDELFTAYPQLRNTTLRFEEMHDGTRGYYSRSDNEIVLNESLRHEPEDTLIHEIQHAIQRAEGFAQGSSPEFWEQIQKGEQPVRVNDRRVAEAERKIREILDSLPQNVADQFELHWNLEKSDPEKALELADELSEGPYGDAFSDFFLYTWEVDLAAAEENYARGAMDLYRNTAGEIEARDAAERRKLTPDERRSKDPVRADDKTVFVEDVDDAAFGELEIDFGDEADLRLGDRYFMDDTDSLGHDLTQEQQEYFAQSQARDSSGRLLVLYHQTDGDFTIFDTRHQGAGSRDSDTPFGIFLKRSAGDIGLSGKKQMALYANIANPLRAESREDLTRKLRRISDSYADTADRIKNLDAEYQEKFDHAKKAFRDFLINWRKEHPDAGRSDIYQDPKFEEVYDAEEAVLDAWTAAADRLSTEAKEAITADLRKAGYDGVFLENDIGSWGRRTDAIIALDPQQVKNVTNKKPTGNPDIRYSIDDDGADLKKREQFRIIQNHNPAPNSYSTWIRSAEECHTFGEVLEDPEWEDYDEFNPDYDRSMAQRALESGRITVYSSYPISQGVFISPSRMEAESYSGSGKVYRKTVNISDVAWIDPTQGQYAKTGSKEKRDRYSVDDAPSEKKETPKKKVTKPVAESRPLIAKKDLRNTVFSLFSIPSEQRAELGNMVDSYADRLIKNGSLTEDDRKAFFDRMYDSGVMTMPANDYYAEARRAIKGSKIFVPDSVVADFGDDWNDIRRRAFGAGIYLTRARTSDGHSVAGIDVWNGDLAAELPGLFDTEETDERSILERIVQVAEEGKDEKLSLAEYTARLAGSEHQSEEEFLDNMERQLDWALRTFAEKARLEVHLRDRTGVKIAQEREGFATRNAKQAERQRAREAQRRADEREAKKDSARRARERKELRELQRPDA